MIFRVCPCVRERTRTWLWIDCHWVEPVGHCQAWWFCFVWRRDVRAKILNAQSNMVRGIEVKGETGCPRSYTEVTGLDSGGTGDKWELKVPLIHQSVPAQIAQDSSCWRLLFTDRPCLFINELRHWFVVLATRLCLGPGRGARGESSQLCCPAVTFTQKADLDLFSVGVSTEAPWRLLGLFLTQLGPKQISCMILELNRQIKGLLLINIWM